MLMISMSTSQWHISNQDFIDFLSTTTTIRAKHFEPTSLDPDVLVVLLLFFLLFITFCHRVYNDKDTNRFNGQFLKTNTE